MVFVEVFPPLIDHLFIFLGTRRDNISFLDCIATLSIKIVCKYQRAYSLVCVAPYVTIKKSHKSFHLWNNSHCDLGGLNLPILCDAHLELSAPPRFALSLYLPQSLTSDGQLMVLSLVCG